MSQFSTVNRGKMAICMEIADVVLQMIIKLELPLGDIDKLEGSRNTILVLAKSLNKYRAQVEQLGWSLDRLFSQQDKYYAALSQFDPVWAFISRNMTGKLINSTIQLWVNY